MEEEKKNEPADEELTSQPHHRFPWMWGKRGFYIGIALVIFGPLIWAFLELAGIELFSLVTGK